MCGICGIYNFNSSPIQEKSIKDMCGVIQHRGPDDEGIYLDGHLGIGMRRLSIIDLDTGHQPISNEDKTVWTVFNGEIYNYIELTEELKKKGHIFKTKSDTEVIVHLFEEYGYDFVKLLRGMFSIAIWDKKNNDLILARDPLGIKQLYYFQDRDKFIFGSEIKCILKAINAKPKVNYEAFSHFLTFLYFPEDLTLFSGIMKLKPGNLIRIKSQKTNILEYCNLNNLQEIKISFQEAQNEFMRLFAESIRLHLRSDVPIGVFLSGGIDSSIITAIASEISENPINTFTVGYGKEGRFYDEREYARIIAKLFNTNHHEFEITPNIEETIYKLVDFFDEPFANSSAIPTYYISQMMRRELKVALSGLGGDEICAGYERQLGMKLLLNFNKLPVSAKRIAGSIINLLPDSKRGSYLVNRTKRFLKASNLTSSEAYYAIISAVDDKKKDSILLNNHPVENSYDLFTGVIKTSKQTDILRSIMYFDLVSYMTNDLLVLTDRTSMANSLEVRVPFLDQRVVEFMFQLPFEYKIKGLQKKYLFKKNIH